MRRHSGRHSQEEEAEGALFPNYQGYAFRLVTSTPLEGVRAMLGDDPDFQIVGERDSAEDIADFVSETRPDIVLLDARLPASRDPRHAAFSASRTPTSG